MHLNFFSRGEKASEAPGFKCCKLMRASKVLDIGNYEDRRLNF